MPANKFQTLLSDIANLVARRSFHVKCELCPFEVKNLSAERYAIARGKMHAINAHRRAAKDDGSALVFGRVSQIFMVWSTTP